MPNWKKVIVSGSDASLNTLSVSNGITGSLFGTSSYALNTLSASFATNASTASSADNFTVRGTLTAQTIVAQTITSSTDFVTGSTRFGSLLSNTHQFTGSVGVTGSLALNGTSVTTGTGANGQVAFWNGTNTQTGDSGLTWNNVNKRLAVGTNNQFIVDSIGNVETRMSTTGSELSPSLISPNWTLNAGWAYGSNTLVRTSSSGLRTAFPTTPITIIANNTYRVIITATVTTGGFTILLGDLTIGTITSSGTNTLYGFVTSTANLSFGAISDASVFTISSLSVQRLDNTTGTTILGGPTTFNSSVNMGNSSITGSPVFINGFSVLRSGGDRRSMMTVNSATNTVTLGSSNLTLVLQGPDALILSSTTEAMRIPGTRNVLINTTTDAGFRLDVNGTFRQTGSTTASGAIARGSLISPTLVAAANNDVLVGLDIAPTFTNGAFTGVSSYGVRLSSGVHVLMQGNSYIFHNNNNSILLGTDGAATYLNYGFGTRPLHFGSLGSGNIIFKSSGNVILDNINSKLLINTTTDAGFRLDVNGTARVQGNTVITGSLTVVTGSAVELQVTSTGVNIGNVITDNHNVTGSFNISGSSNIRGAVTASNLLVSSSGTQQVIIQGSGSAQPIFTVQGSQGELFSITDSLSGSLFSVNDISGLPILEVFSNGDTLIGDYTAPAVYTTRRIASTTAGVNVIYSLATSSYDGVFVDYTIKSGSVGRAGNFMAMWSGSSTDFTDNSINGFGTTSNFVFGASISGSNLIISGSGSTAGWTVKTIIRGI